MARESDARKAAGRYAEQHVAGDDPNGNDAEVLVSDDSFASLAVARKETDLQLTYGDELGEATRRRIENAGESLESAMEARAGVLLDD